MSPYGITRPQWVKYLSSMAPPQANLSSDPYQKCQGWDYSRTPPTHFTNSHDLIIQILQKKIISHMKNNNNIRSQFCTCHDSSAVVTCANLWPGWIIEIMIKSENNFHKISIRGSLSTCTQWVPEVLQVTDLTSKWTVMCLADKPYCSLLLATTLEIWFSHTAIYIFSFIILMIY